MCCARPELSAPATVLEDSTPPLISAGPRGGGLGGPGARQVSTVELAASRAMLAAAPKTQHASSGPSGACSHESAAKKRPILHFRATLPSCFACMAQLPTTLPSRIQEPMDEDEEGVEEDEEAMLRTMAAHRAQALAAAREAERTMEGVFACRTHACVLLLWMR